MKIAACLLWAAFLGLEACHAVPLENSTANHTCLCKKRSQQFLLGLFNSANNNSNCFDIQTLSAVYPAHGNSPEQNRISTAETPFSILSGRTGCLTQLQQSNECFNSMVRDGLPLCISTQQLRNTDHGVFPQFELHIACRGCRADNPQCLDSHDQCYYRENTLSYRPLVKQQRCDEDGYEVWMPVAADTQHRRELNVACSCVRANPVSQ